MISLGYFCSTALEIRRYGLRDGSYPFDWVICQLQDVMSLLESGFAGILRLDQLERDQVHPYIVHDRFSGLAMYHDFDPATPLEEQVDEVTKKYKRRILRLEESVKERTLFLRYVTGIDELAYIEANMDKVLGLLRVSNPDNDLLLISDVDTARTCASSTVYRVAAQPGDTVAREFVSKNVALRWRLITLPYSPLRRLRNYVRFRRSATARAPLRTTVRSAVWRAMSCLVGEARLTRMVSGLKRTRDASLTGHQAGDVITTVRDIEDRAQTPPPYV